MVAASKIVNLEEKKKYSPFDAEALATADIEAMSFEELDQLNTGARTLNSEQVSGIFATYITRCPADWGAANDPQTYKKLPYKSHIVPLVEWFSKEVNGKN
jgi:hypothetical protein